MPDIDGFVHLGWVDTDALTFDPVPTVTVELADWIAPLADNRTLTGGVVEGDMVRFPQHNGAIYIRRSVLGLERPPEP
jgi:hypothetical protein